MRVRHRVPKHIPGIHCKFLGGRTSRKEGREEEDKLLLVQMKIQWGWARAPQVWRTGSWSCSTPITALQAAILSGMCSSCCWWHHHRGAPRCDRPPMLGKDVDKNLLLSLPTWLAASLRAKVGPWLVLFSEAENQRNPPKTSYINDGWTSSQKLKISPKRKFGPDVPADSRPKTTVRPSESWKTNIWHGHAARTFTKNIRSENNRADFPSLSSSQNRGPFTCRPSWAIVDYGWCSLLRTCPGCFNSGICCPSYQEKKNWQRKKCRIVWQNFDIVFFGGSFLMGENT